MFTKRLVVRAEKLSQCAMFALDCDNVRRDVDRPKRLEQREPQEEEPLAGKPAGTSSVRL